MANLKSIRKRISSVKNTQKVTSAMKMVSAAKLRRAQDAIESSRPYALRVNEVLSSLARRVNPIAHPLLAVRDRKKVGIIVISSDRGLCGAFNVNVFKRVEKFVKENKGQFEIELTLVGRKARDYFRRRQHAIRKDYVDIFRRLQYQDCVDIVREVIDDYSQGNVDEVWVCGNIFHSVIRQEVIFDRLLPIPPLEVPEGTQVYGYMFEPEPELLLNQVLPESVTFQIWRFLLESLAGEHGARMTAMDAATNNAGDMIEKLTLQYNRTRQSSITKDLMDIVAGAEALR